MKKIGIIVPSLANGGAERCASNLSQSFNGVFDTDLILFENRMTYPYEGNLICLNLPKSDSFIKKLINIFKRKKELKKLKSKNNYDCCLSLLISANYINVSSRKKERIIVSVRNTMSESNLSIFENYMLSKALKKADCIVSLSEMVKSDLISNYHVNPQKIVTIYNSCDGKRLKELASSEGENPYSSYNYIVTMGRLSYQKGQWHLIRAMKEVLKTFPELKLVVLGQGDDKFKDRLVSLAKNMGVENNIIFAGYIKNPHKIISDAKAFVFPSLYEGLGNVLLEALACNKAIISTDCIAGPREILAPGTDLSTTKNKSLANIEYSQYGILVPSFDKSCDTESIVITDKEMLLAKAIISLLSDSSLKEKYEKESESRITDFSEDRITNEWKKLINKIVE